MESYGIMKNLMIDTLGYAEALEQSGFSREQAKGAAKALNNTVGEELATKADLAQLSTELRAEIAESSAETRTELRAEMAQLGTELRTEMAQLGTELRAEMAQLGTELRTEFNADMTKLRAEIAETRAELKGDIKLNRWMLGVIVIAVVIPLIRDFML